MSVRTHTPTVDHGFKETMEKYNGQWLDGSEITDLVSTLKILGKQFNRLMTLTF